MWRARYSSRHTRRATADASRYFARSGECRIFGAPLQVVKAVVCGSTNYSSRGFFVQSNNPVVIRGQSAVDAFKTAFEGIFAAESSVFHSLAFLAQTAGVIMDALEEVTNDFVYDIAEETS